MPSSDIPHDLVDLLTTDPLGHFSSIRLDGSIATYVMWIDCDGDRILKLSRRYVGADYGFRTAPREIFVVAPDRVRASRGRRR